MRCIQLGFGDPAETEIETLGRNAMPVDSGPSDWDRDKIRTLSVAGMGSILEPPRHGVTHILHLRPHRG